MTFCAGMAAAGMKPFAAIYSTFLQRGYDQVVHDVAIQRLPVRFAIDRAGLVGADGPTHAGAFDVAYLACLPDFVVMAAADEAELVHMVATAAAIDDRPSAFRFPRGEGVGVELPERGVPLEIGRGRIVLEGQGVAILSFGARLAECLKAAEALGARGHPADGGRRALRQAAGPGADPRARRATTQALITIEEGSIGGFGSHVAQLLAEEGVFDRGLKFRSMVLPDSFIQQDSPEKMYAVAGDERRATSRRRCWRCSTSPRWARGGPDGPTRFLSTKYLSAASSKARASLSLRQAPYRDRHPRRASRISSAPRGCTRSRSPAFSPDAGWRRAPQSRPPGRPPWRGRCSRSRPSCRRSPGSRPCRCSGEPLRADPRIFADVELGRSTSRRESHAAARVRLCGSGQLPEIQRVFRTRSPDLNPC